jgi:hypothetical protein
LLWDIGVGSFGAVGCLGALLTLTVAGALRAFSVEREPGGFIVVMIGLAIVIGAISTTMRYKVALRLARKRHVELASDLEGGVAALERHSVTAALRAIMEEHCERAYFLRVEDGRALFVGYWNPAEDDNPAGITTMDPDLPTYPMTEIEIARAPNSGLILDVTFSGKPLAVETTFVHRQGMNTPSLNVGEFSPVPWEQIRQTYG